MKRRSDGVWVDAETGEVIAADLPRSLQSAVDAALGACCALPDPPGRPHPEQVRAALRKRALRVVAGLEAERDTLVARIEHGWGWCDRHPANARFAEREETVIAWIGHYESMQRAISLAQEALQ